MEFLLDRLGYDILWRISDMFLLARDLSSLSLTSKSIRDACVPVLFRNAHVTSAHITSDTFIPRHLWLYVQCLTFYGPWRERHSTRVPCLEPLSLAEVFENMPRLSHISIRDIQLYGVPWASLVAILAHAGLRVLDMQDSLHHWDIEDMPASDLFFPAPPLTTYRHSLPDYRSRPRDLQGDLHPLACLASQRQFQLSLRTLVVPSEAVPFAKLAAAEWQHLTVLHIRGERPSETPPLVCAFGKMPVLQELYLNLACTRTTGRVMICNPDWSGPFPWPELKSLVVSYPHPEDPLYSHLPTCLRHLALRCWPRRYIHVLSHERPILTELGWYPYILNASEMIQILSRCGSANLEELELEFEVDERHIELLHTISVVFPHLASLTVFRYRKPGNPYIPVQEIGKALAPLVCLRTLYLHLDFQDVPHPYGMSDYGGPQEFERLHETLQETANILAQELAPSVSVICLLQRKESQNLWMPFRVAPRSDDIVHAPFCLDIAGNLDVRREDEPGPPYSPPLNMAYYNDDDR